MRGFLQSAQMLALREGHQRLRSRPSFESPARRSGRPRGQPDRVRRRRFPRRASRGRSQSRQAAQGRRPGRGPDLHGARDGARLRPGRSHRREGGRFLRHRRAHADGAGAGQGHRGRRRAGQGQRQAAGAREGDPGAAQGPHRQLRVGRGRLRRAEEIRPRPHPGGARGQARPGDRPRRGDPPHHPGAEPPHQEQSRADRRARRRQDRHRRGPGAAHRQRRRAGIAQGQEADGARPRRHGRRRQVSAASSRSG